MGELDKLYNDTVNYIEGLEKSYLTKYLADATASPNDYDLDVKSYCILCHAAFEEFVETIALKVMDNTIENFVTSHIISEPLVSLMHFKSTGESYLNKAEEENKIEIITSYDYIRNKLLEIKERFSKEIFNNHGVSLKYIKQLLMPVAIDIPNDPNLLNSLKKLANERGAYADKLRDKGSIRKSISPENAKEFVEDCIKLCIDLLKKANVKTGNAKALASGNQSKKERIKKWLITKIEKW